MLARKVDQNALRTNQAFIITLLLVAFFAAVPLLVVFVAVVMLIGAAYPPARLFVLIYQYLLKPTGLIKPDVIEDNPEPHRFALGLGGVFTALSALALFAGLATLGWALSILVVILAGLNLFLGFCAGCFVYYQLNKLGVPGFKPCPIGRASLMLERILIFGIVLVGVYLAYHWLKGWQLERVTRQIELEPDPLLADFKVGVPGVMLFTADYCAPCKSQQRPAIQRLVQQIGLEHIQVIEVDVQANPQAASLWGVLSLPTTYILDKNGQPRQVNYGVTSTEKLKKQLEAIG